jgi:hypothetical protein
MKTRYCAAALVCTLLSFSSTVVTRAADDADDKWQFSSTPLLWASGLEGDVTLHGRTVDVDLGFDDLFDVTEFGFNTYLELRKKKFGFYASPSYIKLSGDGENRLVKAEFEQDFWVVEGGYFHNLVDTGGERPLTVDAIAGLRYWNISTDVELQGLGRGGRSLELDSSTVLADPIFGARAQKYLTKKLSLNLRGDMGGFGIFGSDSSHFSWQAMGLLGYDINEKFSAFGGYRALSANADEGSGTSKKGFDAIMHGLMLGLQIRW